MSFSNQFERKTDLFTMMLIKKKNFSSLLFVLFVFTTLCFNRVLLDDASNNNQDADDEWISICDKHIFRKESCRCPVLDVYNADRKLNSTHNEEEALLLKACQLLGLIKNCSTSDLEHFEKTYCSVNSTSTVHPELQAACQRFGIQSNACSCPRLYHISSNKKNVTNQCVASSAGDGSFGHQIEWDEGLHEFTFNDLSSICSYLHINASACKCPDIGNINASFVEICKFIGLPSVDESQCQVVPYTRGRKIFVVIVSIFGIVGNSIVILIRSQQWRNSIHYRLISGLAFSDLTFSVLQIIFNAPAIFGSCKWTYGLTMCKMYALLGIGYSIDLGFAVIISIERFIAIVHPLSNSFEKRNVFCFVLVNLIYSVIGVLPAVMVLGISNKDICKEDWNGFPISSLDYTWIMLLFYFVIPVVVIAVLYNISMCALKKSIFRRLSAIHNASKTKLLMENRRILIVMNTIVVTLVLLVTPYHIHLLIIEYVGVRQLGIRTLALLQCLTLSSYSLTVMVNPVIYSLIDRHFRANAKYMLFHLKYRKRSFNSSTTLNTFVTTPNERPVSQPPLLSRRKSSV